MDHQREEGLRFAKRVYPLRAIGLGLGFFAVAAAFWQLDRHLLAWAALAAHGFVWPHAAYLIAKRAADPYRAERYNLVADSALGGVWVPLMGFNLLPSVLIVVMLSMDKVSVGGVRFLGRCAAAQLAAGAAMGIALGWEFRPESTMLNVFAGLPLLIAYPLLVGAVSYRLARRVREQNRQLQALTRVDSLSGLLNRRSWEAAASAEFNRTRRSRRPSALLMLDIDHFKQINDRHGHPAGDEVIRGVGAILRDALREHDTAGRYGGEEFGMILAEADAAKGQAIAERIRKRIGSTTFGPGGVLRCTASIGIAGDADAQDYRQWIQHADRALYRAKDLGRNCTVMDQGVEP